MKGYLQKDYLQRSILIVLGFALLVFSTQLIAQEGDPIGTVVIATGDVQGRSASGDLRELSRGSSVYVGDSVLTAVDASAQINLIDEGIITFASDTEFTFTDYTYDGVGGAPDNAIMNMVKGGFRTISGTIGEDTQDTYRVDTEYASIGIRGTTYAIQIIDNVLYTTVTEGGISVANSFNIISVGANAATTFSQTALAQASIGVVQLPAAVSQAISQLIINTNIAAAGAGVGAAGAGGGAAAGAGASAFAIGGVVVAPIAVGVAGIAAVINVVSEDDNANVTTTTTTATATSAR